VPLVLPKGATLHKKPVVFTCYLTNKIVGAADDIYCLLNVLCPEPKSAAYSFSQLLYPLNDLLYLLFYRFERQL